MRSLPSFRINYGNYKKLFPDGKVFWYPIVDFTEDPIEHLWNSWVRWIIYMLVNDNMPILQRPPSRLLIGMTGACRQKN